MNNKQKTTIIAPLVLIVVMYPIFQLLAGAFGETIGWYLGLVFILANLGCGVSFSYYWEGKHKNDNSSTKNKQEDFFTCIIPCTNGVTLQVDPRNGIPETERVDIPSFIVNDIWEWLL